jgi:type IV pilus assembly protein PilP
MKMTAMCKSNPFKRMGASALCLFFLAFAAPGCGKSERPKKPEPVVIKKRISEEEKPAAGAQEKASVAQKAGQPAPEKQVPPEAPGPPAAKVPGATEGVQAKPATESSVEAAAPAISLTEKLAEVAPRYNPKGKIDPFQPLFREKAAIISNAEKKYVRRRPLTPLEKIDLGQLKLVGIIRAKSGNLAMVEDATGKGYVIAKGTYIGVNGGQVVKISKDGAIVQEKLENIFGKRTVSQKELKLQRPAGEE